jgi:toxin ParE1/3/4
MPSHSEQLPLKLSPKARKDFIDILRYTGEKWGQEQLLIYRDKINEALLAISHNPQLGHGRDDLPLTHLAYLVGSHIIIYRKNADSLGIIRILHQRMSLAKRV